jgi:fumarate reductase subunit C
MDDEHRCPYVGIINNLWWKQCHIYSHFGLIKAYFIKVCLPNLFLEWTLQYIFSCNYYKYALLDYGLGLRLGHINSFASFSQVYSN